MSHIKHIKLIVSGRVQGVGFRYFVNDLAKKYKLKGWVMNCSDGSVEVRLEGDLGTINVCVAEIIKGNRFSHVENINKEEMYRLGEYHDFTIRYF